MIRQYGFFFGLIGMILGIVLHATTITCILIGFLSIAILAVVQWRLDRRSKVFLVSWLAGSLSYILMVGWFKLFDCLISH